jgi:hypothetical protein
VVLVAHVLLLLGLLRLTLLHLDAPIEDAASILLLEPADFAPHQRAAPEPEPGPAPAAAAPATASPPAAATSASDADRTAPSGDSSTHSGGVTAPGWFDWFRVGESVARDRVARAAAATRPARPPFLKTPEGPRSTINENCYVTTDSDSITQRELHEAHKGMTRCMIPLGKRQARGKQVAGDGWSAGIGGRKGKKHRWMAGASLRYGAAGFARQRGVLYVVSSTPRHERWAGTWHEPTTRRVPRL